MSQNNPISARLDFAPSSREHGQLWNCWARDRSSGRHVSVWTIPDPSSSGALRHQIENEQAWINQLHHRLSGGLQPVLVAGREGGTIYWATPLVRGATLLDRINRRPLSIPEAVALARSALAVLAGLHEAGFVHGDIRPRNVILDAQRNCSPTLVNRIPSFAATTLHQIPLGLEEQIERAQYLPPEKSHATFLPLDPGGDLYSLGAVLFESLAGEPWLIGPTLADIQAQRFHPPAAHERLPRDTPDFLARILEHLLAVDPVQRYQSAAGALYDFDWLAQELDGGEPATGVVGLEDPRHALADPSFVGRRNELKVFQDLLERARQGTGQLLCIDAPSGTGKSRLLDEFEKKARRSGALVLRGQGAERIAKRPYQALSGIAQSFVDHTRRAPAMADGLERRLGFHARTLCRILPELRPLFPSTCRDPVADTGPEQHAGARSLAALTELLNSLGDPHRPAVVLIDDYQWADPLSVELLSFWLRRLSILPHPQAREGERHILVVIAFRSEEVRPDHPLRALKPSATLRLPALTNAEISQMVRSMTGPAPPYLVRRAEEVSRGNPFTLQAFLHGLIESGTLAHDGRSWVASREIRESVLSSAQATGLLLQRLGLLPAATLRLLSTAAVLGKKFDLPFLAALSGLSPDEARATLEEAFSRRLIIAEGETVSFFHDKIREALLERLNDEEERRLHRAAADKLKAADGASVFDIAFHYDAAGLHETAHPYALEAARTAREQFNFHVAGENYRIALKAARPAPETQMRLLTELGEVLSRQGMYDEARAALSRALMLASTKFDQARLHGHLGDVFLRQGDVATSTQLIGQALRLLGQRVPTGRFSLWTACAWERMKHALAAPMRALFPARDAPPVDAMARLLSELYQNYFLAHYFMGPVGSLWASLRLLNLMERYGPSTQLGAAHATYGGIEAVWTRFDSAIRHIEKAIALHRRFGDLPGEAQAQFYHAVVIYPAGRFDEAVASTRAAMSLLDRAGDRRSYNDAHLVLPFLSLRRGRLKQAFEEARRIHADGIALGDTHASGMAIGIMAKASGGNLAPELVEEELRRSTGDLFTGTEVRQAQAQVLMQQGRYQEAADALENARRDFEATGLRLEYVVPVYLYLAEIYRHLAEGTKLWEPRRREECLALARRRLRKGLRLAKGFRNNLAHAYRERALLAAAENKPRTARRYLAKSMAEARRLEARVELAASRWYLSRIRMARGESGAEAEAADAARELALLDAEFIMAREVPSARLFPARETRLDPENIAAAIRPLLETSTAPDLLEAARDACGALLDAESRVLLRTDASHGASHGLFGADVDTDTDADDTDADLIARAIATGQPQIAPAPGTEPVRPHVAIPVHVEKDHWAVVYSVLRAPSPDPGATAAIAEMLTSLLKTALAAGKDSTSFAGLGAEVSPASVPPSWPESMQLH